MKKLVLILGGVVALALFSVTLPCGNQVLAISGCCKERQSEKHAWFNSGKTFGECKRLKEKEGEGNIFHKTGRYWWDVAC